MNLVFASGFLLPQHTIVEYFNGVQDHFEKQGHQVLTHAVPPISSSPTRAAVLAKAIRGKFPTGSIHIVAHSMGGLDSRYLIAGNSDLADRIVSLTMLSTPNHGSPLADLLLGSFLVRLIFRSVVNAIGALGFDADAPDDLTKEGAERAPDVAKSHPQITYLSYAASGRVGVPPTSAVLLLSHGYILRATNGGPNDGAVPVESAKYGQFQEPPWPCDHLDMVGLNLNVVGGSKFRHLDAYDEIIAKLQALPPRP